MKKLISFFALIMCLFTLLGSLSIFGAGYKSYTYSFFGMPVDSPDAYTPDKQIDAADMNLSASSDPLIYEPTDMVVDDKENVYIVDRKINRVIMLDRNYKFKMEFGTFFINDQGVPDSLSSPNGMFVTADSIYVTDTDNSRIVIFNRDGSFQRIVQEPRSDVMGDDSIFKPVAIAVNDTGTMYVVSSTTYRGIIVLNRDGGFNTFMGAQKVAASAADILWRQFQTAEQRALSRRYVSTEYNNITIDNKGFVYVTTSSIDEGMQESSLTSKTGDYAPVKKLNSSGRDVMSRTGFFGPGGEVYFMDKAISKTSITGVSKITDVALGPEETWSIVDAKRSKVYTYDQYGRLLHVFGDQGSMLGNIVSIGAIAYQGDKILVLDKTSLNITVYQRTEYGDIIINALKNNNERNYDRAVDDWNSILQRNSNFDSAYVGLGKAYYRSGDWETAMEYFKYAHNSVEYSSAFKMYRKEWVSKYVLVIPVVVVAVVFGIVKLFTHAAKVNKRGILKKGKRKFSEEVFYAFHLFSHPFDGFWDLKHEKRGSVRGAIFWVVLAIAAFAYNTLGTSYLFKRGYGTITSLMLSILVPLFLWVTSNWCLTTLFDGEGSYKDVFIASSYSLAPLPMLIIPATICTHFFTLNEMGIYDMMINFAWVLVGVLVFIGMMVTHGYSLFKNLLTCVSTIVGAAFLIFVALLFTGLVQKILGFVSSIVTELSYRM